MNTTFDNVSEYGVSFVEDRVRQCMVRDNRQRDENRARVCTPMDRKKKKEKRN